MPESNTLLVSRLREARALETNSIDLGTLCAYIAALHLKRSTQQGVVEDIWVPEAETFAEMAVDYMPDVKQSIDKRVEELVSTGFNEGGIRSKREQLRLEAQTRLEELFPKIQEDYMPLVQRIAEGTEKGIRLKYSNGYIKLESSERDGVYIIKIRSEKDRRFNLNILNGELNHVFKGWDTLNGDAKMYGRYEG